MIKKLRRKLIAVTMCSIAIVLGIMISIINIFNYCGIDQQAEELLSVLSANGGRFPEPERHHRDLNLEQKLSPEAPFTTRYFSVVVNKEGTVLSVNTGKIAAVSTRVAAEYAEELFRKGKTSGFLGNYKYNKIDYDGNSMYIFLDRSLELSTFYSFLFASILVSLFGMLLVFILVLLLSKIIVKPITESYEKQKRFLTDAGHEIKTPLAIIDANTEVLEIEGGENEWTVSIKNQIKRLKALTEELVFLSKMDEEKLVLSMEEFSFSELVSDMAESFGMVAGTQGKTLTLEGNEAFSFYGNEAAIRQLLSVLLDNAIKYSNQQGHITVSLQVLGKKAEFKVKNTVDHVIEGNLDRLFERFYRPDSARNSEAGGHGLGLSAAKAVTEVHKGRIDAWYENGDTICFSVIFPVGVHK